jgi:hypothetical protein
VTSRRLGGALAALLAGGTLVAGGVAGGTASSAAADSGGTPGYCPTKEGVTVVVDFQELGGGIVVRCAPGPVVPGYTGLDALQDAGFTPEGVRQYGLAFICRIAGKPAPDQKLAIEGDPNYRENCNQTPPQAAFWGYWYAPNGGSWTYSQVAAMNRDAIPGGFEGWSFSLNHAPGDSPPPGVAPKRPPHEPPTSPPPTSPPTHSPPTQPPTHSPTHPPTQPPTHPSPPTQPTHRATQSSGVGSPAQGSTPPTGQAQTTKGRHRASGEAVSTTSPVPTGWAPATGSASGTDPVAMGHNAAGERVSGELPDVASSDGGSAMTAVGGLGLVALLVAGGGVAAWRRRASRE